MRNTKKLLFALIAFAALINQPLRALQKEPPPPAVYQLDIKKSRLLWTAPKNQHNGFILFKSGTLGNISAGWPTTGTFIIDMNSMRSVDASTAARRKKNDDKLRSEEFFAVSKYPTATMVVNRIVPQANGSAFKVYGELKIRDVNKPIEFTAVMKQTGNLLTATANTNISRANWKIAKEPETAAWNILDRLKDNMIANDIPIILKLVFIKR